MEAAAAERPLSSVTEDLRLSEPAEDVATPESSLRSQPDTDVGARDDDFDQISAWERMLGSGYHSEL